MVNELLNQLLNEVGKKLGFEDLQVILSNRPEVSDYQCDACFRLAKIHHESPMVIGEKIVNEIKNHEKYEDYFQEVSFASPGFINFKLSDSFINRVLRMMEESDNFGIKKADEPLTFVLDYGGPNIAKPLHVGHMRTAIVGESIKRIINYMGHKTIADVHLGDFGLQIGQVIYGIIEKGIKIEDLTLEQLSEIYPWMSGRCKEDEALKAECARITKSIQDDEPDYLDYYHKVYELSKNDIKRIYDYLDVHFDLWYGEMDSRPFIKPVENILKEKGLLQDSQGVKVVDVREEGDTKEIPPLIYQKSNGAYLYGSTDMATIYEREQDFHPDYILYITDLRQSLHFTQVFRASLKSGITDAKLEHLGYGTINGMDGKPYKTRSGETPKLDDLFKDVEQIFISKKEDNKELSEEDRKKIVNSILKFADLQNSREKDYIFDINKFSNVVGKTGPYVLYTYLRIHKILQNEKNVHNLSNMVYNEEDRNLRLKLMELDRAVKTAYETRKPHYIVDYIYNLALLTNAFYQNNHILGLEDETKKEDWLYVLHLTSRILKEMLHLVMIEIPENM